jgi:hypothetical protein
MKKIDFKLWLEFENAEGWNDLTNDFAYIGVDLMDGRYYGINVWTYGFFDKAVNYDISKNEDGKGLYLVPPDLFVRELTRKCIEQTVTELLKQGDLEELLNPSIFGLKFLEPWCDVLEMIDLGESLFTELINELNPEHKLYGQKIEVLAIRDDNNDILIGFENEQLALVHLTFSGKIEENNYPLTEFYINEKDFWKRKMKKDIMEFKNFKNNGILR